jgi:hypothetical protein
MMTKPTTLEDVFTLIHQNQLFVITKMTQAHLPLPFLSSKLQNIHEALLHISYEEEGFGGEPIICTPVSLLGIEISQKNIHCHYNVPLRSHSASLCLIYDRETDETVIRIEFLGVNLGRWNFFSKFMDAIYQSQAIRLEGQEAVSITENALSLECTLGNNTDFNALCGVIGTMLKFTLAHNDDSRRYRSFSDSNRDHIGAYAIPIGKYFFDHLDNNTHGLRGWQLVHTNRWTRKVDCHGIDFINMYLKSARGQEALVELSRQKEAVEDIRTQLNVFYELLLQGPCRGVVIEGDEGRELLLDEEVSTPIIPAASSLLPHYLERRVCVEQCVELLILLRKTKEGQQIVNTQLQRLQESNANDEVSLRLKNDLIELQKLFEAKN